MVREPMTPYTKLWKTRREYVLRQETDEVKLHSEWVDVVANEYQVSKRSSHRQIRRSLFHGHPDDWGNRWQRCDREGNYVLLDRPTPA
jgi:hypothetical protein